MTNKDAFDLWWEWADKPVDNKNRRAAPFKKCDARPEYASRISEQRNLS
jgi:hypothetical protein